MAKAVVLDAFGTVCRITQKRNPYGKLFRHLGVDPLVARKRALTEALDFRQLAAALAGGTIDTEVQAAINATALAAFPGFEEDLKAELDSIQAYPEACEVMTELRKRGYKLAIASNLALPYGSPVEKLFSELVDCFVFSYAVGAAKPEAAIFEEVRRNLDISFEELLMVGDSEKNDYDGARACGMKALRLARNAEQTNGGNDTSRKNNFPAIINLRGILDYPGI